MKKNRLLSGIIALVAVGATVLACEKQEEEAEPSISVSTSSVTFTETGGGEVIKIKSTRDWTASCDAGWVSVSPSYGSASDNYTEVSIFAEENDGDSRTATVTFSIPTMSNEVAVYQLAKDTPQGEITGDGSAENPYSVDAALLLINNGLDSSVAVYTKGIVSKVDNIDINHGDASYYISFDGSTELAQLYVCLGYSLGNKEFTSEFDLEVGDEVVICGMLTKDGSTSEIARGNCLYSLNGQTYVDYGEITGDGTEDDPYSVDAALKQINDGTYTYQPVYTQGIVSRIESIDLTTGYASYYISYNGSTDATQLFVYHGYSLRNEKFSSKDELSVGDEVIVCGLLTMVGTIPGIAGGNYIYFINGKTDVDHGEMTGDGTEDDPYSVDAALNQINGGINADDPVYTKGIVSKIESIDLITGYANYYISYNGSAEATQLYVYLGYSLGKQKFASKDELQVGDEIIVYGILTMDGATSEIARDNYIYTLNGQPYVDYGEITGDGTEDNPYSVDAALKQINDGTNTYQPVYTQGVVSEIESIDLVAGYASYYISYNGSADATQIYVCLGYGFNYEKFTSAEEMKVGDEVIVYGALTMDGATPKIARDNFIYSLNGELSFEVSQYMTDSDFKSYCLNNFDTDGNGKLSFKEADEVTEINCSTAKDFTGIEYFPNLERFTSTSVETVDFGSNTKLNYIYMKGAPIKDLDLSANLDLTLMVDDAFRSCSSLASITLPESVTAIGNYAFYDCTGLTSITLPKSMTLIGDYAFGYCSGLTSISLPESLTSIGNYAFGYCTGLTSISLPESLTSIGDYAFRGCTDLASVTFSKSLTAIGDGSFYDCTGLTSITFPEGLTAIGKYAFRNCTGLYSIILPKNIATFDYAFYECTGLTSVTFPESLTTIGEYAFYGCTGLTSVTFPESLTTIGECAFCLCTGLKSVAFPESLTSTGKNAFAGCTGLTSITFPESLTAISDGAFLGCSGLTSVTFPESLTYIGESSFQQCTGLTSITWSKNIETVDWWAFMYCTGLTSITFPEGLTYIGSWAFYECTGLRSITLPESLTRIGGQTFCQCPLLGTVTSKAIIPPEINNTFDGIASPATLYVPAESVDAYANDYLWGYYFSKIFSIR